MTRANESRILQEMSLAHRSLALALALVFATGGATLCQGWLSTGEGRMACCSDEQRCPMHSKEQRGSGSARALTQADADACCAWSEQQQPDRNPESVTAAVSSAVSGPGVVIPPEVPHLVLSTRWRAWAPSPSAPIDRYVLLSVFLI